eukprot:scaffold4917_cov120-Cylindrotheca_fusiformis.AAC.6
MNGNTKQDEEREADGNAVLDYNWILEIGMFVCGGSAWNSVWLSYESHEGGGIDLGHGLANLTEPK